MTIQYFIQDEKVFFYSFRNSIILLFNLEEDAIFFDNCQLLLLTKEICSKWNLNLENIFFNY